MGMKAVQLYLAQDVLGTTASSVQAANPTLWATSADVPWYAYRSIGEMLILGTTSSSVLMTRVINDLDEGKEQPQGCIVLQPVNYASVAIPGNGFDSNRTGAETAVIDLKFMLQRAPGISTNQRMENLMLRVRYLLDETWRAKRRVRPNIPNLGDNTITNYVRCTWIKHPSIPRSDEAYERYILCFDRAVPQA